MLIVLPIGGGTAIIGGATGVGVVTREIGAAVVVVVFVFCGGGAGGMMVIRSPIMAFAFWCVFVNNGLTMKTYHKINPHTMTMAMNVPIFMTVSSC